MDGADLVWHAIQADLTDEVCRGGTSQSVTLLVIFD